MNGESILPRPKLGGLIRIDCLGSVHLVIPDGVHPGQLRHYREHFLTVDVHLGF